MENSLYEVLTTNTLLNEELISISKSLREYLLYLQKNKLIDGDISLDTIILNGTSVDITKTFEKMRRKIKYYDFWMKYEYEDKLMDELAINYITFIINIIKDASIFREFKKDGSLNSHLTMHQYTNLYNHAFDSDVWQDEKMIIQGKLIDKDALSKRKRHHLYLIDYLK